MVHPDWLVMTPPVSTHLSSERVCTRIEYSSLRERMIDPIIEQQLAGAESVY
jgi:hypothetical protein